jgi:hypothetical protein
LPGARLRLGSRAADRGFSLQLNENRPGSRVSFSASLHERRNGIAIERAVEGALSGRAFGWERDLGQAIVRPQAPFAGAAEFHRGAALRNRWTGDLTLDFPGKSNVALTGADVHATLVPALRSDRWLHPHHL